MSAFVKEEEAVRAPATTSRKRRWLVLALVAALVAAVAFGVGTYVGDKNAAPTPEGLAPADVVAVIDGQLAAFNSGDMTKMGSYYTEDAIFEEPGPTAKPVQGRAEIIRIMRGLYNMGAQYNRIGAVIYTNGTASYPVSGPGSTEIDVVLLNADLKIEHYWVILH